MELEEIEMEEEDEERWPDQISLTIQGLKLRTRLSSVFVGNGQDYKWQGPLQ